MHSPQRFLSLAEVAQLPPVRPHEAPAEEIVNTSFSSIDGLLRRGQRITGLATHYSRLDEMTSGLQPSDLIILAGLRWARLPSL
jgi:replicative DNA helicase